MSSVIILKASRGTGLYGAVHTVQCTLTQYSGYDEFTVTNLPNRPDFPVTVWATDKVTVLGDSQSGQGCSTTHISLENSSMNMLCFRQT